MLLKIYKMLLGSFGPQDWWPVQNSFDPPELEVCIGAILTQNTNWKNVEKALSNLSGAGITSVEDFLKTPEKELAELIRPAGYFNQKVRKIREFISFSGEIDRENLLSLWGIGPETADSMLLYAYRKPYFVIDAYTRRVFSRIGLICGNENYEKLRKIFEDSLPKDVSLYKEYHALIVQLAKQHCKKVVECKGCPVGGVCKKAINLLGD